MGAILDLTWDRVDLDARRINLRRPGIDRQLKGRAVVPINDTAFQALHRAKEQARSEWVVEYGGQKVASVKKGVGTVARKAKLPGVSAHIFRHSAAVWQAEAGASMASIAQFLGHEDERITFRVYARFSPTYLAKNAAALEL